MEKSEIIGWINVRFLGENFFKLESRQRILKTKEANFIREKKKCEELDFFKITDFCSLKDTLRK